MSDIYAFEADSLTDQHVPLSQYRGKVLLIVNTASECGFTPRYAGLETVYERLHDKGLEVLGFPCNQSGKREPGDADEISTFYEKSYGVSFPMFGKININGSSTHPLYRWLTLEEPGVFGTGTIGWGFTKFLLRYDGTVYKRHAPLTKSEEIADDIERLLVEPDPV